MSFLRAGDTISGKEGKATIKINGKIEDLYMIKELEATFEKNKEEVKTLGSRGTGHKSVGWTGTGSVTLYYVSTLFRRLALEYVRTGKDVYFDITVTNEDATSTIGKQTVALYNCNLDSVILAKLAVDDEVLEEDADFTFEDFDILDEFGKPINI